LKPEGRVAPTMEKLLHNQPGRPLAVAVAVAGSSDVHDQIDPHFSPAIGFVTTWPILVRTKPRID